MVIQLGESVHSCEPILLLNPLWIEQSRCIPWFTKNSTESNLQNIIDLGLEDKNNFFAKREALDEYGWRNFGDLYADHESHNYEGELPFISHYNNQYDPLLSFYRQFYLTADSRWKTLAVDLLDHTLNIDIYNTELDKPEYNYGLFWHTDHYVEAATATHRTYSKHQNGSYSNHTGGGGPGSHHCYSSGLALGYYATSDESAKQTVINMAEWMQNIYEGDNTILGKVLHIKNAQHLTLPFSDKLLLGTGTGVTRNPITEKYPLDRGTGNYINVLLDAFDLTMDESYLSKAEYVILNTIDKNDDLLSGKFDNVETTWYYTVVLQATAKYLYLIGTMDLKREFCELVTESFLHYIDYIAAHEQTYLTAPEKLEYPNDTWTGQDLRKIQLLFIATWFAPQEKIDSYVTKANQLLKEVEQRLSDSDEKTYTRILVLSMQNYGGESLLATKPDSFDIQKCFTGSVKRLNKSWTKKCLRFLKHYSIKKERRHLVIRIPKLRKLLGSP